MASTELPIASTFNLDLGKHSKIVGVTTHADKVSGSGRDSVYWCYLCEHRVNESASTWGSKRYVQPSTEGIWKAWTHVARHFTREEILCALANLVVHDPNSKQEKFLRIILEDSAVVMKRNPKILKKGR